MGIGIRNISSYSSSSYKRYLAEQLREIEELTPQQSYLSNELTAKQGPSNLTRYTRCAGGLAELWGLTGPLDSAKLATIAKLEMGEDPRTSAFVGVKHLTIRTIKQVDGTIHKLTNQEYKNGYYLNDAKERVNFKRSDIEETYKDVRKQAIETVYTIDSTFSYFYTQLSDKDKMRFEQAFMDSAEEARKTMLEPYMQASTGETGKLLTYDFLHKDNRDGHPHLHIHSETSNLILLANGEIRAIEIPAIKEPGFHDAMDVYFKATFMEKFETLFPQVKVEAYTADRQPAKSNEKIKDWRVAFDNETLEKINSMSNTAEAIEREVAKQSKIAKAKFEDNKLSAIKSLVGMKIDADACNRKIKNFELTYEKELTRIHSRKNKSDIQTRIKRDKAKENVRDKDVRLAELTDEMKLVVKRADGQTRLHTRSDSKILEDLTNTSPFFSKHQLISECVRSHGKAGYARANSLIDELSKSNELINTKAGFTLKSLCDLEVKNVEMMRRQLNKPSHHKINNISEQVEKIANATGKSPNQEQLDFIKSVFDEKNASIVIGVPGAGKSMAMSFASDIAKSHNIRTIGIAPTGKVATALRNDTSVDMAMTIDKLNLEIQKGTITLGRNDIVFLDEASMVGTRNWNKLLSNLNGAKIVAVGDTNQIQSVSVGNTLNEFANDKEINKSISYLTEIRRQQNAVSLSIAKTTSLQEEYRTGNANNVKRSGNHVAKAVEIMSDNGRLSTNHETEEDKVKAITSDYFSSQSGFKDKLILASTNASIDLINKQIQGSRIDKGELKGPSLQAGTEQLYTGDRVVMKVNNKDEFNNGDFGTIKKIKGNVATVLFDNNKTKEIEINRQTKIGLAYATSIHKSQGMTVNDTFIFGENSQVNNSELFNVAMTRNRHNVKLYTTDYEFDSVVNSFKRFDERASLVELSKNYQPSSAKPLGEREFPKSEAPKTAQPSRAVINQVLKNRALYNAPEPHQEQVKTTLPQAEQKPKPTSDAIERLRQLNKAESQIKTKTRTPGFGMRF